MRVLIDKVTPLDPNAPFSDQQVTYNGRRFQKMSMKNACFVGFPIQLYLRFILPENNDYEYLKVKISAQNSDNKLMIKGVNEIFKEIKRDNTTRDLLFDFTPSSKSTIFVRTELTNKVKPFIHSAQQAEERSQMKKIEVEIEEPFELNENIVFSERSDKANYFVFPLLVQYWITSKVPNMLLPISLEFFSDRFKHKFLNSETKITLDYRQGYAAMLEIHPHSARQIEQRNLRLGILRLTFMKDSRIQRKIELRPIDHPILFNARASKCFIPKKDLSDVEIIFSRCLNFETGLGNLTLSFDEQQCPGIKVIGLSKESLNLETQQSDSVVISLVCFKSGLQKLTGLILQSQKKPIKFDNRIWIEVENESQDKNEQALESKKAIKVELI